MSKNSKRDIIEITNNFEDSIKDKLIKKINIFQEIMRNTLLSLNLHKKNDLFNSSEINACTEKINEIYNKANNIITQNYDSQICIEQLQNIIDELSIIISNYGTMNLEDLLFVIFGSDYSRLLFNSEILNDKYSLIKNHIHPIGFKTIKWKSNHDDTTNIKTDNTCCEKIIEDEVNYEFQNSLECFDIEINTKNFYKKIYGIQIIFQNELFQKTLIIKGLADDINLDMFSNKYIDDRKDKISKSICGNQYIDTNVFEKLLDVSTIKDILIYGDKDFQKRYEIIIRRVNEFSNNSIEKNIKMFLDMDIISQRLLLISLMIYVKNNETQYYTYLLYDLLNLNNNQATTNVDSSEQHKIYNSFTWKMQLFFKDAMKHTIKYTQEMINKYDNNKISYEQQIYLLKVSESVKEKALVKLKEIKGRNDDMSIKSKQYLEGLLKIPFGIYKEEPILKIIKENNVKFNILKDVIITDNQNVLIPNKPKYTNYEIMNVTNSNITVYRNKLDDELISIIKSLNNKNLISLFNIYNTDSGDKSRLKLKKKDEIINFFIDNMRTSTDVVLSKIYNNIQGVIANNHIVKKYFTTYNDCKEIYKRGQYVNTSMQKITEILDESIYGHTHAKKQILKIIGQWINGEQSGYCFGFEGSPGIGKTSLAKKGLAKCLLDEQDNSRPFSFIALGGSANGSTLEGHSYTYVNSTWGKIVDILMETKYMNPIIYIDELDKVSKTEHGKEIIGILTHLIDYTQNMGFQDKYFSGIELDLSKALFIFSYNDPEQIDRILLDRIHRIKFDNLSIQEKVVIVTKYILPDINNKMGFNNVVELNKEIIEYIIEFYTLESGVRKLKEIIFDLFGEINIELLNPNTDDCYELPIKITIAHLDKYLHKYNKINEKKIHKSPDIGIINGLWANSLGKGGIISIESIFYPSSILLDFKLTGLQGDVMKESMNVAKNLAWSLTPIKIKKSLLETFRTTMCQGIHVHCPEGAVSKDGPSAGAAITISIYSLLNNKQIKNDIAITGEIDLQGNITAIGGLENKITGGIRSGIRTFMFPKENKNDFNTFIAKNDDKTLIKDIKFIEVSHISELLKIVFI